MQTFLLKKNAFSYFLRLFKTFFFLRLDKLLSTGVISKAIYKSSEEDKKEEEVKKTLEQHDNIVTHYKKVIREQVRGSHSISLFLEAVYTDFWSYHHADIVKQVRRNPTMQVCLKNTKAKNNWLNSSVSA